MVAASASWLGGDSGGGADDIDDYWLHEWLVSNETEPRSQHHPPLRSQWPLERCVRNV
jgi:hypothetical protein